MSTTMTLRTRYTINLEYDKIYTLTKTIPREYIEYPVTENFEYLKNIRS